MQEKKLRIAHICLASSYTEGMLYQDNILPQINSEDGHDVLIISDCTCYVDGKITETPEITKRIKDNLRLVRLKFSFKFIPSSLRNKIRYAPRLFSLLENFQPDVILHHSIVGMSLLAAGEYKKKHPLTRLYIDNHADFNNSGKSLLSITLQYRLYNKFLWDNISKYVDKVLYVSGESREFLHEIYKINNSQMEFYPLGGFIQSESEKINSRRLVRHRLNIPETDTLFIHAGKLNKSKLTIETIEAFSGTSNTKFRLLIAGTFEDDIHIKAKFLIEKDSRIIYVGWKSGAELIELLSASDCYLQPGTQSATLQAAICCGLPIIVYPYPSHSSYLINNGYYAKNTNEILAAINKFNDYENIKKMSRESLKIGQELLDYRKIAERLYK